MKKRISVPAEVKAWSARRGLKPPVSIAASGQITAKKYDPALIKAEVRCAAARRVHHQQGSAVCPIKVDHAHLADWLCTEPLW